MVQHTEINQCNTPHSQDEEKKPHERLDDEQAFDKI